MQENDVVYMRRTRSLSLKHLLIIRKWLLQSYIACDESGDLEGKKELQEVGREVRRIIDHIQDPENQFSAKYVVW